MPPTALTPPLELQIVAGPSLKKTPQNECPTKAPKSASGSTLEAIVEISGAKTPPKMLPKTTLKVNFSENGDIAIRPLFTTLQPCWPLPNGIQNPQNKITKTETPKSTPQITAKITHRGAKCAERAQIGAGRASQKHPK